MDNQETYYTRESLKKEKEKLSILEKEERPKIVDAMQKARDKGDLKENAAYHVARKELNFMDMQIRELRNAIGLAQIIDESNIDTSKVSIFTSVKLKNKTTSKEITYQLVPAQESNISEGKISVNSPIAKGLLGKKKGETANIRIPAGTITFEVMDISA